MIEDGDRPGGGEGADQPHLPPADRNMLGRLREIGEQIDRLEAERCRLLATAERSGTFERAGAATPAAWLRRHSSLTAAQASTRAKIARRLPDLPVVADTFAAGRVGVAHLQALDRLCADLGVDLVAPVDAELAAVATSLPDVASFRRATISWRHALAPDWLDDRDERNHAARRLSITNTFEGAVHINGRLDAEGGSIVRTALTALMSPDGPDVPPEERRTPSQRLADALVDGAGLLLRTGQLPTVAGERPHVVVRIEEPDLTDLRPLLAALADGPLGSACDLAERRATRPPELDGIGPVGRATARRIAADSALVRLVVNADGQPLDIGTATRVWPTGIRRAITDRDRGCRFPGCDRSPAMCDIDHIDEVADGGPTRERNGILLCRRHHRAKRPDGWWPALRPCGTVAWRHADGRVLADPPPSAIDHAVQQLLDAMPPSGSSQWSPTPPPDTASDDRPSYRPGSQLSGSPPASRAAPASGPRSRRAAVRRTRSAARRRPPPSRRTATG